MTWLLVGALLAGFPGLLLPQDRQLRAQADEQSAVNLIFTLR